MKNAPRIALALGSAAALIGFAGAAVGGPVPDVPPHRHFVDLGGGKLVPVGPQVCGRPSLQDAFNRFHFGVHVGTPGEFAMDHEHNRADIVPRPC